MIDPDFVRLLALEKRLFGEAGHSIFGNYLGLFLHEAPQTWGYYSTPLNSITFASTGGDGVHFGFLQTREAGLYPVVMTAPANGWHGPASDNVILGESLREFLSLGFHGIFWELEALTHRYDFTVRSLSKSVRPPSFEDYALMPILTLEEKMKIEAVLGESWQEKSLMYPIIEEFNLQPWQNIEQRLAELRECYLPKLQLADFAEWEAKQPLRENRLERHLL